VIDDELLQDLLGKATGHYNNGDYQKAIDAWKEALEVDPGSQKAREGIQMATLLLAGCEPIVEETPEPEPSPPADGARASVEGLGTEELEARLDRGIARVRGLLNDRKYSEAVEGARSLVPMDPDSEEIQRLVEEAQQAFEAAPFIEEHLTLSRELASQDRLAEAEAECRKVFVLDRANPDAHNLIAELRRRARAEKPAAPAAPAPAAPAAAEPPEIGGMTVKMDLSDVLEDLSGPESVPAEPESALPESPASVTPAGATPGGEEPLAEPLPTDLFDFELDLGGPGTAAQGIEASQAEEKTEPAAPAPAHSAPEADIEIVDADTVVPPSVRLVPRGGEEPQDSQSWLEKLDASEPPPPRQDARELEPDPPLAKGEASGAGSGGWEQELESLNLKTGEHDILGRSAARAPATAPQAVDSDLSSLLEEDAGSPISIAPVPEPEQKPEESPEEAAPIRPRRGETARAAARARAAQREEMEEAPGESGSRRSLPLWFGLLGVVLLAAGGTAWWFFFQPQTAKGLATSAVTPPSASSGEKPGVGQEPIPTPIGSTSREPVKPTQPSDEAAAVQGRQAAKESSAPAPAPPPPAQAAAAPVVEPPPQPPPRPRSPEELRAEVLRHMTEGRRMVAAEKWREARDEFAAVIALDPVNFEGKELLDQAQIRYDQEVKVRKDLDEAKSSFEDKNYQGALWKLYRLPRDPRLGDIDRAIRNSWYNWAVMCLKNGDATNALQKLNEALSADPDDADAVKLQEVATRYASKPKDKVFYSYADALKYRAFDQP
jgi:tetratricopeptide (TPR) repeat protein